MERYVPLEFLDLNNAAQVAEYEAFVQSCPKCNFSQSTMWARVKTDWNFEAVIVRDENGNIEGTMGVLVRQVPVFKATMLYSPRGPVCDIHNKDVMRRLKEGVDALAKKHGAYIYKIDPDVKSDDEEFWAICKDLGFTMPVDSKNFEGIQPRYVFRLYLDGRNDEELLASFHQKTRYNIRVALKKGVEVKIEGTDKVEDFYNIMLETGIRDNFVIRNAAYFKRLLESLGDHARLYMAYLDGKAIAGTIAIWYGDKVWYLYGASSDSYRNVMPNYLLQYEMIKWAVEKNCRVYDFRGVSGDISEDNPLYGLYRFKKGFNGEFTEFIGEMSIVYRPAFNKFLKFAEKNYRRLNMIKFKLKNKR